MSNSLNFKNEVIIQYDIRARPNKKSIAIFCLSPFIRRNFKYNCNISICLCSHLSQETKHHPTKNRLNYPTVGETYDTIHLEKLIENAAESMHSIPLMQID